MKTPSLPNDLARALRDFFVDHIPRVRGLSPHTARSYRDGIVLLLRFVAAASGMDVVLLDLDDIDPKQVLAYLDDLEGTRRCSAATRNVRLAAIHTFFRYLALSQPERLEQCQRVMAVPFKRSRPRTIQYLESEEIQSVLATIDRCSADGRRDYALLVTLFNTGARVQEILDVRPCDIQLIRPYQVRLMGKGRKERYCPLWPQTAEVLRDYQSQVGSVPGDRERLFRNHVGLPLTRFGVRYILRKYCALAATAAPTLVGKRLHPHSMRHSTAVHLLRSGVDLVTISHWLGHASVTTTNRYTAVDLDAKREALAKAKPIDSPTTDTAAWRSDASIIKWLESL